MGQKKKKILVYCWGSFSEQSAIRAMNKIGYQVFTISGKIKEHHADAEFAQRLITEIHSTKPDVVFSYDYFPLVSMLCEMNHIPYAAWIYDCPQYMLMSKTLTNSCNYIFCFDLIYSKRLMELGAINVYHFPLSADVDMYSDPEGKKGNKYYTCDISFVGSLYNGGKNRLLTKKLSQYAEGYIEGLMCSQKEIYGYNLIAEALTGDIAQEVVDKCELVLSDSYISDTVRMAADAINMKLTARDREEVLMTLSKHFNVTLYSNSKLSDSLRCNRRLIVKDPVDYWKEMPRVFRNSKINLNITSRTIESGIPQRVFDILACGGFCLTNYQSEIAEFFEDGKELVMYTDMDDMIQKVEYYLKHNYERIRIAGNGYKKIRECFCITDRIDELMEMI